jgi:hypothetical protein
MLPFLVRPLGTFELKFAAAAFIKEQFVLSLRQRPFNIAVVFRIIWRTISELFGVMVARRTTMSQIGRSTEMPAIHKQDYALTP